jgi:hypothetical protein
MVRSCVVLVGCLLSAAIQAQSPPVVLTSNATFGPLDPALAGKDVVVQGATVTLNGPHNLQSLTVQGAGVVTHSANYSYLGAFGMHLSVAGDVVVQAGSTIHANRRGYPAGTGPGAGPVGPIIAEGGAGHGGGGGYGSGNSGTSVGGGPAYGDYAAPNLPGSGGASCCGGAEREGGGVIRLTVGGTLTVDGVVAADGFTGFGSGAGGSVWIDCGTFAGVGVVRANGGTHMAGGGGSGGGRVAIYAASSTYAGTVTALQGAGTPASAGRGGGAGTVFFANASPGGTLIYDGGGVLADVGSPLPGGTDVGRLEVRGGAGALLGVAGADVTGDVIVDGGGSRLRIDGPLSAGGDVAILNGAFVDHTGGIWTGAITALGAMTIGAGSFITADVRGHAPGMGPGAGGTGNSNALGGGAHGGGGGWGLGGGGWTADGGALYGDFAAPSLPGSGGGVAGTLGIGGGVVRLSVGGMLTLDGIVTANGQSAGSAGAGGSVWIDCGTFAGNGAVRANGGANTSSGGGGGGGRVAIYAASSSYVGAVAALPGAGTPVSAGRGGGAGTVFLGYASPGGTLIYDGGGPQANVRSPIAGGAAVGRLEVRGGAGASVGAAGANVADDLIVDGAGSRMGVDGPLTAGGDVAILNGAFVDHTGGIWTGAITALGAMTIDAASFITADVRGHTPGMGPGAGVTGNSNAVGGGAHGGGGGWGMGGGGWTAGGGAPYGDYAAPSLPGSGGGGTGTLGVGGGVVRLSVGGTLTLDGIVTANGQSAGSSGAGGSVWIDCATFAGNGVVRANGGANPASGGGGGGGRVAIYAASSTFVGAVTALQGAATPLSAGRNGGVGTVFLGYASPGGTLVYDGGGVAAHVATTAPSDLKIGALIVEGGAVARIGTAGIRLLQDLQVDGAGSALIVDGTVHVGGAAAITGGAGVTHTQATEGARFVIGGDFFLDAASAINLDGKGHVSMSAPGHGHPACSAAVHSLFRYAQLAHRVRRRRRRERRCGRYFAALLLLPHDAS